jgi:hypothetical protein
MSYNLTVQQELGRNFVLDTAYVGNQGRQIPAGYNLNADRSAPGAGAPGQPLYGITGGVNNSIHRVADTNLLGIGTNSNYNSLQVRVIRRATHGLTNTTSYTWGKAMGNVSSDKALGYYNYYIEPQRNYSRVDWDQTHMFRESLLYALPFGRAGKFLQHGIAGQVFGGWEVGTVIGLDSGLPMTFTSSGTGYNSPGNTVVADQIKPFVKLKKIGSGNYWFDPTAFVASPANRNGNTGQNMYSGPAQFSFDANLTRSFAFHGALHAAHEAKRVSGNKYAAVQQPDHVPYQQRLRLYYKGRRQSAITACCNAELLMVRCAGCEDRNATRTTKSPMQHEAPPKGH